MMRKYVSAMFATLVSVAVAMGQQTGIHEGAVIKAYPIEVTWDKTTVLIFPSPVASADRGSRHVLTKRDDEASNILRVKAGAKGFPESNLSVVTRDGRFYHFAVSYADTPACQVVDMGAQAGFEEAVALFSGVSVSREEVSGMAAEVAGKEPFMRKKARENRVRMRLAGIYAKDDVLFFHIELRNGSRLDYNTDQWRFNIRDRKQVKRTAVREQEVHPLYTYTEKGDGIRGKGRNTLVFAFKRFTIADKKRFDILLFEESGDRNLRLSVKGRHLLKARPLVAGQQPNKTENDGSGKH